MRLARGPLRVGRGEESWRAATNKGEERLDVLRASGRRGGVTNSHTKRMVAELTSAAAMSNPRHCAGLADKGALQMG